MQAACEARDGLRIGVVARGAHQHLAAARGRQQLRAARGQHVAQRQFEPLGNVLGREADVAVELVDERCFSAKAP